MINAFLRTTLWFGMLILALQAQAQVAPDQLESRFERDREPLSEPGSAIPRFDPLSPPPAAADITFRLGGVRISGNTAISDQDLASSYEGLVGSAISVSQVFAIANRITTIYGESGFPLSRAIVPAQEIGPTGTVQVIVVEGFVDRVIVDEDASANWLLEEHAGRIETEKPLSSKTLERNLLLADDLPGISVRSVLRRSEDTTGATTILLDVERTPPFSWSLTLDNRGSEAVGPLQFDMLGEFNNLVHRNSHTTLRLVNASLSDELLFTTAEHLAVLNSAGTTLEFGARYSRALPGTDIFTSIDLETEATTVFAELRHPFIRSRNRNLEIYGIIEARNSETRSLGTALSRDRIRSVRAGLDFDNSDQVGGLNEVTLEVSQGINGLGATENGATLASREFGRVDYTKATIEASRTQPLGGLTPDLSKWSMELAMFGQVAGSPLLSSEECTLGGADFGRAFDPAEISGDQCISGSIEMRYRLENPPLVDSLQLYGFADAGSVSDLDPGASPASSSLSSAGVGARFSFMDRYSGSLEVAQPISNSATSSNGSPRVFFSVTGEF